MQVPLSNIASITDAKVMVFCTGCGPAYGRSVPIAAPSLRARFSAWRSACDALHAWRLPASHGAQHKAMVITATQWHPSAHPASTSLLALTQQAEEVGLPGPERHGLICSALHQTCFEHCSTACISRQAPGCRSLWGHRSELSTADLLQRGLTPAMLDTVRCSNALLTIPLRMMVSITGKSSVFANVPLNLGGYGVYPWLKRLESGGRRPEALLLPAMSPAGKLLGGQLKLYDVWRKQFRAQGDDAGARGYLTLGSKREAPKSTFAGGEMPLHAWMVSKPRASAQRIVGLCEGALKPLIAAACLQMNVIGAQGGEFQSKHNDHAGHILLEYLLQAGEELAVEEHVAWPTSVLEQVPAASELRVPALHILLLPDAGVCFNADIAIKFVRAARLCQSVGYKVRVLWWHQAYKPGQAESQRDDARLQPIFQLARQYVFADLRSRLNAQAIVAGKPVNSNPLPPLEPWAGSDAVLLQQCMAALMTFDVDEYSVARTIVLCRADGSGTVDLRALLTKQLQLHDWCSAWLSDGVKDQFKKWGVCIASAGEPAESKWDVQPECEVQPTAAAVRALAKLAMSRPLTPSRKVALQGALVPAPPVLPTLGLPEPAELVTPAELGAEQPGLCQIDTLLQGITTPELRQAMSAALLGVLPEGALADNKPAAPIVQDCPHTVAVPAWNPCEEHSDSIDDMQVQASMPSLHAAAEQAAWASIVPQLRARSRMSDSSTRSSRSSSASSDVSAGTVSGRHAQEASAAAEVRPAGTASDMALHQTLPSETPSPAAVQAAWSIAQAFVEWGLSLDLQRQPDVWPPAVDILQ